MPLRRLNLGGCRNIRDLTPLAECEELRELVLPRGIGVAHPVQNPVLQ